MKQTTARFRTNYNSKLITSTLKDKTKHTVPGMALTNSEHLKKAKLGLSDQAVKVIFDPEDIYPDVRAMDLVDKHMLVKQARQVVQDIKAKAAEFEQKRIADEQEKHNAEIAAREKQIEELVTRNINNKTQRG